MSFFKTLLFDSFTFLTSFILDHFRAIILLISHPVLGPQLIVQQSQKGKGDYCEVDPFFLLVLSNSILLLFTFKQLLSIDDIHFTLTTGKVNSSVLIGLLTALCLSLTQLWTVRFLDWVGRFLGDLYEVIRTERALNWLLKRRYKLQSKAGKTLRQRRLKALEFSLSVGVVYIALLLFGVSYIPSELVKKPIVWLYEFEINEEKVLLVKNFLVLTFNSEPNYYHLYDRSIAIVAIVAAMTSPFLAAPGLLFFSAEKLVRPHAHVTIIKGFLGGMAFFLLLIPSAILTTKAYLWLSATEIPKDIVINQLLCHVSDTGPFKAIVSLTNAMDRPILFQKNGFDIRLEYFNVAENGDLVSKARDAALGPENYYMVKSHEIYTTLTSFADDVFLPAREGGAVELYSNDPSSNYRQFEEWHLEKARLDAAFIPTL